METKRLPQRPSLLLRPSVSTLPIRNGNEYHKLDYAVIPLVSTLPIRNGNLKPSTVSVPLFFSKYLTYKEWKQSKILFSIYCFNHFLVSTLPIRNGNSTILLKNNIKTSFVSTLPIRNGNSPICGIYFPQAS